MAATGTARRGLTLTELLVVITIIVIVSSILTPMIQPALKGREIREAARQINTFLESARSRALQKGRPVAVWIERDPNNVRNAFQLRIAEVPPPYTGDTVGAGAKVSLENSTFGGIPLGKAELVASPQAFKFIAPGDEIRFNYRGARYEIVTVPTSVTDSTVTFKPVDLSQKLPVPNIQHALPYQVFRKPRLSPATPLDLPVGTVIVAPLSGIGTSPSELGPDNTPLCRWFDPVDVDQTPLLSQPLVITFLPEGRVDWLYRNGVQDTTPSNKRRPLGTIYLFVGRAGETPLANLGDAANLWITINPGSGPITTASNSTIDPTQVQQDLVRAVVAARALATSAQGLEDDDIDG